MTLRPFVPLLPLACALACTGTTSDDPADDGSSSSVSTDASATMTTTTSTTMSTSDATTTSPTTSSTDDSGGSSSAEASSDGGSSSDDADGSGTDESSTGGPANDCTDVKDPCVLELDAPHEGGGGVDQFFLYTVGDGNEHVQFDGIADDYASWDVSPGGFLCDLTGPCCLSEGSVCDKALNGQGVAFAAGDPVYLYVYANAPYTLTITSG